MVKGHPSIINLKRFIDVELPMLYTKVQPLIFLSYGWEVFLVFYHMWEWQPSFSGAESFEQIVNILSTEGPIWNLVKIVQDV